LDAIQIRRLLNRGKLATDQTGSLSIKISPLISGTPDEYGMNFDAVRAQEAALQEWYDQLSHYTKFDGNINVDIFPPAIDTHQSNVSWLRTTYTSLMAVYMWPAVDIVLSASALRYMASGSKLLDNRMSPQIFQICTGYYPSHVLLMI